MTADDGGGLGIDVGARALHVVELVPDGRVVRAQSIAPGDLDRLVDRVASTGTLVAAIDGPAGLSVRAHAADPSLAPKFRRGRCSEIALGRGRGIWVPWVTPAVGDPLPTWMEASIAVHGAFAHAGAETLETYPQGIFRTLAGSTLPPKTTPAGLAARVALLERAGVVAPELATWGHDLVDAAAAALVALQRAAGRAVAVTCPEDDGLCHDGSAIWLPGGD